MMPITDQGLLAILQQSPNATAIYSTPELHIRFVNNAMLTIWGKDSSIVGKTFEEALPEIIGQPFTSLLNQVWQSGKTYTATNTPATLMINGQPKVSFFDFEFRPLLDIHNRTYAILHTAIDVTGRLWAEQQVAQKQQREEQLIAELLESSNQMNTANENLISANRHLQVSNNDISHLNQRLLESETNFKRLVQQAPVAILVFRSKDMVIDLVNDAMLEVLGKDSSIVGKPLLEGLPEIKDAPAVNMLFEVFNTGSTFDGSVEPVPIKRNGEVQTRYFNFSYRPLRNHTEVIGVMDIAVEVTEQVLARKHLEHIIAEKSLLEQDLRANEQRLQGILDTMAEGVVIADNTGKLTYANPMAQRILGINEEQFRTRIYNDAKWQNQRLDGSPLPAQDHPMFVTLNTGATIHDQEIAVRIPGKEKIYISINAAPLLDSRQQITGAIVTFTDVTSQRLILQQKDDFISVASHELKTPVTSLKASLQLLSRMKKNFQPEKLEHFIDQANKSLNKLNDLVNSLLNSNRISQGRFPIHKKTFAISDVINDCCEHVSVPGTHQIIIKGDLDLKITADEQLFEQVIVNLVNNAVKYAPHSREIEITVKEQKDQVRIAVTDHGPGIAPEKAAHIFERYYQGEYGGRHFSGLGLGLYIAAEIVRKHGGDIGVDSEPGHGSTFWFTLPLN